MYESENISETLNQAAVKISTSDGVEGSGILYVPKATENVVFIITAKHCLRGAHLQYSPKPENLTIRLCNGLEYKPSLQERIFYHPTADFAMVEISKDNIFNLVGNVPAINLVEDNGGELSTAFYGFPKIATTANAARVNALILPPITSSVIFLESSIESEENMTAHTVEGFSGSGLGLICAGQVYLIGTVTNFEDWKRFKCASISLLNDILVTGGLCPEPVLTIETNPDLISGCSILNNNTNDLLNNIGGKIDEIHLERRRLLLDAEDLLASNDALLIYGNAGVGKSAITKDLLGHQTKKNGSKIITFNGAQICKTNLTETLAALRVNQPLNALLESRDWLGNKIIYIDSAEKALENDQITVLKDLVNLPLKHPGLKVVLSIRSYALTQTAFSLINDLKVRQAKLEIGLLTDEDLHPLILKHPKISELLRNKKVQSLVRTPFYLKQIIAILDELEADTIDEAQLKGKLWLKVVRKDKIERERTFLTIAIKRATRLTPYITISEAINGDALRELLYDNIVIEHSDEFGNHEYAPSHDVFEDWALVKHVAQSYSEAGDFVTFVTRVGPSYAIKRGFRFWLQELYRVDRQKAKAITLEIVNKASHDSWKSEVITSLLNSSSCADFMNDNASVVLQEGAALLLRIIHLLRTTCKITGDLIADPQANEGKAYLSSNTLLPAGPGWLAVIAFINTHFEQLGSYHFIISQLLIDWKNGVDHGSAALERPSVELVLKLLFIYKDANQGRNTGITDFLAKQLIKLVFQLPAAAPELVGSYLDESFSFVQAEKPIDVTAEYYNLRTFHKTVIEIAMNWSDNEQLCKYFPDLIIEVSRHSWVLSEQENIITRGPGKSIRSVYHEISDDVRDLKPEQLFGLQSEYKRSYNPASALQTPIPHLLKYHPDLALTFILSLLNTAVERYARHPAVKQTGISMINVSLPDDKEVIQIGNQNLWLMYRGGARTPDLLQCVLMALENYLLELATENTVESKSQLIVIFDQIINSSNNVATTAVLASITMAHPFIVRERMFSFFQSSEMLVWDFHRLVEEHQFFFDISFYDKPFWLKRDRMISKDMPHRKERLDSLLLKMSLYEGYGQKIVEIVDKHKEQLASHAIADGGWTTILRRMDRRNYTFEPYRDDNMVGFVMQPIQEATQSGTVEGSLPNDEAINVWNWCNEILYKGNEQNNNLENWRRYFGLSKMCLEKNNLDNALYNAPAGVAAIGLKYYFPRLAADEIDWCKAILLDVASYFVQEEDTHSGLMSIGKYSSFNKDEALISLPLLFSNGVEDEIKEKIKSLLISQLYKMPISDGLSKPLFERISKACWEHIPSLGDQCFRSLVLLGSTANPKESLVDIAQLVLKGTLSVGTAGSFKGETINRLYLDKAYLMISERPEIDAEGALFINNYLDFLLAGTFRNASARFNWKKRSHDYYDGDFHFRDKFGKIVLEQSDSIAKGFFRQLIGHFLVGSGASIDHLTDESIEFGSKCIEQVIRYEDVNSNSNRFNDLWTILAAETLKSLRPVFLRLLLLNIGWKDDARTWKALENNPDLYKKLISVLGAFDPGSSIKLMSGIGFDLLFPDSIQLVAQIMKSDISKETSLTTSLQSYDAEKLVQRSFFLHGAQIRNDQNLRAAFIQILDTMVEKGSSIGYLIKENISSVATG